MKNEDRPTDGDLEKVQEPAVVSLPLWSRWVDSKRKLWIVVERSSYELVDGRYQAVQVGCLNVEREVVQHFSVAAVTERIREGKLTRLSGGIEVEPV